GGGGAGLWVCRGRRYGSGPDNHGIAEFPHLPRRTAMAEPVSSPTPARRVRALLLGDRINTANVDRLQVVAAAPLTFKCADGLVTLFRYGVAVLIGLAPTQEEEVLRELRPRVSRPLDVPEEETAFVEIDAAKDDQILPGGPIV